MTEMKSNMRGLKPLYGKEKEECDDLTAKEAITLIENGILPPIWGTKEEIASLRKLAKKLSCGVSVQ